MEENNDNNPKPLAVAETPRVAVTASTSTPVPNTGTEELIGGLIQEAIQREVAYTIKDVCFPAFDIYKSANAWWMDTRKVDNLILSFKNGSPVNVACAYIGISRGQWEYFNEVHPQFSVVKEGCDAFFDGLAIKTIGNKISNPKVAMWWLDRRMFKKVVFKDGEGGDKTTPALVQTNIQINNGIQAEQIKEVVSRAIRDVELELARTSEAESKGDDAERVAGTDQG